MCTDDTAVTSEITVHVYYWKFQWVSVLKYNCSLFWSPKNMHIYCCRTYCTSIYTFIIFTVMAGWHQGSSIRFCMNFSSVLIPQCLSPPAQRWISPSCRLSVEIRHYWLYLPVKVSGWLHLRFCFVAGLVITHKCARVLTPPPSVGHVTGGREWRESNETLEKCARSFEVVCGLMVRAWCTG